MLSSIKALPIIQKIQTVDLSLHNLQIKRGTLPQDIARLEQKLKENQQQIEERKQVITSWDKEIKSLQHDIKEAQKKILTTESSLKESTKEDVIEDLKEEIAIQELDIQFYKKKTKQNQEQIVQAKNYINSFKAEAKQQKELLSDYKKKLQEIKKNSEKEEKKIQKERESLVEQVKDIDIFDTYTRLRQQLKNPITFVINAIGLGSYCAGCHMLIPIQKQIDIKTKKRIVSCENCARILAHVEEREDRVVIKKKSSKKEKKTS